MIKENKIPEAEVRKIPRSTINFATYNPRVIEEEAKKKLSTFVRKKLYGGIVWNEDTANLVSGHQRVSIADKANKYNHETKENDYWITVSIANLSDKEEKEHNLFFNSGAVQGKFDYKKIAEIYNDIDASLAGLDEVDVSMIEVELPNHMDIEIPSFEPQEEKKINAEYEKSITQELSNIKHVPEASVHEMERKQAAEELTAEEKKAKIKEIKEKVKEGARLDGEPYFTVSFSDYEAKVMFLEYLGFNPEDKFIKGEELQEKIDEVYAS